MPIPTNKTLENLLDYTSIKQKVIGQNIANANTKNYIRRDVEFKEVLDNRIKNLANKDQKDARFEVKVDEETPVIANGNNVDVNREMADMAKNSIMFKFASKKLNGYFQSLQSVIKGGS
ncbi:MAG: flagellar basal body rod protein FlgB [Ignavibacteriae bacterium]|nr:flagellar basal body rod protein FlgB [Ignavibacteriota bacterium]MCB9206129.1 flagellar basal body rod protein FlgB [Ignavibacteriales bacterium]MCB9209402.1 flagellar basal body rod protein FlgB [Ignavibacteriales bacterium]MCB9258045.1 flagellar basal body rod protein FlgB [Ignavibacteriales bacterium]